MCEPTELTVERKRNKVVVGFRSSKIANDALIATIGRELLDICDRTADCDAILLNFRGVGLLSSAMIGNIVLLNKKAKACGITLKICNVAPEIMSIFELSRPNKPFPTVDYDEEDDDDDQDPEASGCRVPRPTNPSGDSMHGELAEETPDEENEAQTDI